MLYYQKSKHQPTKVNPKNEQLPTLKTERLKIHPQHQQLPAQQNFNPEDTHAWIAQSTATRGLSINIRQMGCKYV